MTDLVWYAAYGSNMAALRLSHYIQGGQPPGACRVYPGARDRTLPTRVEPLMLPGRVYFALESKVWGGGMAFYDPDAEGSTPARAYLMTVGQFSDLAEQEMHRQPSSDLAVTDAVRSGRHRFGPGRYETLVCTGRLCGWPVLTLTAPWSLAEAQLSAPSAGYLRMLGAGLAEGHGWSRERIAGYLSSLPGARGVWSAAEVERVLVLDPEVCGSA